MAKNSGSGGLPRNKGMILSCGGYIQFLDADDTLTKTALAEMYTLAKNFDADVVYCEKHFETDADGKNMRVGARQKGKFVDKPTFETNDMPERVNRILKEQIVPSTCFKFARRKLMIEHEIFFPQICPAEDDVWTYGLVFYAKKFLRVPNAIYIRRWTEGSVMRKERTPQQKITFWCNPVLLGLKALDDLISRHEFFQKNPQYHYAVLEKFLGKVVFFLEASFQLPPFAVYETIKQVFGTKLGEHDVLIAALCTLVNTLQRASFINNQQFQQFATQAQKRVTQLESIIQAQQKNNAANVQQFQQFATQAQARVAELESVIKAQQKVNVANIQQFQQFAAQAQARIAQLEAELKRRQI